MKRNRRILVIDVGGTHVKLLVLFSFLPGRIGDGTSTMFLDSQE